jgi:hypothetical protein
VSPNAISYPSAMMAKGGEAKAGPRSGAGKWLNSDAKIDPMLAAKGGAVKTTGPGQKAVTKGDSYKNDKVPALLSQGEIVIDKDTLNKPDPVRAAAEFVARTLAKRRMTMRAA